MKIAFFTQAPFSRTLGASKNRIELGEALTQLGWQASYVGNDLLGLPVDTIVMGEQYNNALKDYLLKKADNYDVIVYEYNSLPFERDLFSKKTLFVARPALLNYHFDTVKIKYDLKTNLRNAYVSVKSIFSNKKGAPMLDANTGAKSLQNSDVIQVQNTFDQHLLQTKFPDKSIIKVPNGIGVDRFSDFQAINRNYDNILDKPVIAFVGTFDYRKGAVDFITILREVKKQYPNVIIRLIGTKGVFQTEEGVRNFFPKYLRKNLEVIPKFQPKDLPELLKTCHLGVFPSYIESFGFGALEMMCSGLPVVGYKCAGPSDFLIQDLLVNIGDTKSLIKKVNALIADRTLIVEKSIEAKKIAEQYRWDKIAANASAMYKAAIEKKLSA